MEDRDLSKKIIEEVEDLVAQEVEDIVPEEVSRQLQKKFDEKFLKKFYKFQADLRYHKMVYGFFVASGVMLFWFGTWRILSSISFFQNGVAAFFIGLFLLVITGTVYRKLVD